MDIIAGILELLGLWIVGNKSRIGFLVNMLAGLVWIAYVFVVGHTYGLLIVVIPALFINFRNYRKWVKDVKSENG